MEKIIKRYNQLMGYTPSHIPGQFTKEELEDRRKQNALMKKYLEKKSN